MTNKEIVIIFKALSDEKRIEIIKLLKHGELCACDLLDRLEMKQSGLSYHMRILLDSKLVNCRHKGKWCFYSLSNDGKEFAKIELESLLKIESNTNICMCDLKKEN